MQNSGKIFIIDDDVHILEYMKDLMEGTPYDVSIFNSAKKAVDEIDANPPDLVISDVKMDAMTGDEVLNHVKKNHPEIGVIIITGFGNIAHSVNAMQKGAFDYITKPFTGNEFTRRIDQFFSIKESNKLPVNQDTSQSGKKKPPSNSQVPASARIMVGQNEQVEHLKNIVQQIAPTTAPVLIEGESGTGKEVYADLIQKNSTRANAPFIKINCANLPGELVESTLFGHVKGAFTGAVNDYDGAFKMADGGTLLLDEITETNVNVQAKMLRVLQEKEFQKVGSQKPQKVDVRIIATTNRNPAKAIKNGEFREDLYFRLNVFPIRIPTLRERKDDIPLLAQHFCDKYTNEYNLPVKKITKSLKDHLLTMDWPGNIRQLENYILRGVVMAQDSSTLDVSHCDNKLFKNMDSTKSDGQFDIKVMPLDEMELLLIKKALEQTNGNQKKAAELLNVTDRTIRNKLKKIDFPSNSD